MKTLGRFRQISRQLWPACIALMLLAAAACKTPRTLPPEPLSEPSPPPLALETFDEVWRILDENHFDTNYNGNNWNEVRHEFRPRAASAASTRELRDVIQEMLELLDVSHLAIVPGDLANTGDEEDDGGGDGTPGMQVRFAEGNLLVTRIEPGSSADAAGVKPGWIIRRIDSTNVEALKARVPDTLDQQRREFLAWRRVVQKLSGFPGSSVEIEFLDGQDETVTLTLERQLPPGETVHFGDLPPFRVHLTSDTLQHDNAEIGLIRFDIWMLPSALAFNRAIDEHRGKDGIIIDLRGNVGGVVGMIIGTAGHFVTEPLSLGAIITRDNTLKLPANPRFSNARGERVEPFSGPVAILVDEITASASEVFTGGLQEHGRVRVFGRRTAGQALPAVYERLPNGDALYHPVADFITARGVRFEGRGVIPDVPIPLERSHLLKGEDTTLQRAAHWITRETNQK